MKFVEKCIYCGRFFNPQRGQGDHVLAARLFGEFEGDRRFRGNCVLCNNRFGQSEQLLAQATPLGLSRWIVSPNLGRRAGRGGLVQRGAKGGQCPIFTMELDGRQVLVSPSPQSPLEAELVDQIVIRDESGKDHPIRVYKGTTLEQLQGEIVASKVSNVREVCVFCEPHLQEHFKKLCAVVFPESRLSQERELAGGYERLRGRATYQFSMAYFQAIAKIAFHYYLVYGRRGYRGDEAPFAAIRKFIKYGGTIDDKDAFFRTPRLRFEVPFGQRVGEKLVAPLHWLHVFAADESGQEIVVCMRLFAGPGHVPNPIYVTIGRPDSSIVIPRAFWGHGFKYEVERRGRFAGRVFELSPTRIR